MEKEKLVVMAVAAIAEELQIDIKKVRVISFKEVSEDENQTILGGSINE